MHLATMIVVFFGIIATSTAVLIKSSIFESEAIRQRKYAKDESVIEVAIVCDQEFGQIFRNDISSIRNYWTAFFWDLQQRFRTLSSSKIYFRVNSIYVISEPIYERFFDSLPRNNGKLHIPSALKRYQYWIEDRLEYLPKFDVAMVVTGLPYEEVLGISFIGGACDIDYRFGIVQSIMLMSIRTTDPVNVATHEMAHLLGSNHDNDSRKCPLGFIMSEQADRINYPYQFSLCSDAAIKKFLATEQAQCLRHCNYYYSDAIIDTRDLSNDDFEGVTVQQQCNMLLNSTAAVVRYDEGECKPVTCMYKNPPYSTTPYHTESLNPIDGRHCQNNGRCYQGSCQKPAFKLVNMATGKCLLKINSSNITSEMDKLVLSECSQHDKFTPFQFFTVKDMEPFGKFLELSSHSKDNGDDRCLACKNGTDFSLTFQPCSKFNECGWDFVRVNFVSDGTFIFMHRITKRCITTFDNFTVITSVCSWKDPRMRWKLVHSNETMFLNYTFLTNANGLFDVQRENESHTWLGGVILLMVEEGHGSYGPYFLVLIILVCLLEGVLILILLWCCWKYAFKDVEYTDLTVS